MNHFKFSSLLLILFVGLALTISSCGKESGEDLNINVQLKYGAENLVLFSDIEYPDGTIIQITNLSFYISEIVASNGAESEMVSEVEFWRFDGSHMNTESAKEGKDFTIENVELSDINSLDFNIGLTEEQNDGVPSDYSSDNPLSLSSEHWLSWDSYIFVKIEGFYDSDGDAEPDAGFLLHLGSDPITTPVSLSNLSVDENNTIKLQCDVKSIFDNGTEVYDLLTTPRIHSLDQIDLALFLAGNLSSSFSVSE